MSVSRPLFLTFFTSFTPNLSLFTATYRLFWYFFTGTKIIFTCILLRIFTCWDYFFTCTILPEKIESARQNVFWYFSWFFSRPLFFIFLGQSEVFSGTFSNFFSGWFFFFLGQKFMNFKVFFPFGRENLKYFSRAKNFFFGLNFAVFSWAQIFFSGCFQDFFLGQFVNFSGRILKLFSGSIFFLG